MPPHPALPEGLRPALPEGLRPGGRFGEWRPTPPRYVVADVDGTLLGVSHRATDRVVDAAEQLARTGVVVGFATGREWEGVVELQRQLGLPGPHVLHNGGEVRADGEILTRWALPPAQTRQLLDICREDNLYAELYVGEGFVVTDRRAEAHPHWQLLGKEPDGVVGYDVDVHELGDVVKSTVILAEGRDPHLDVVMDQLAAIGASASAGWAPPTPELTYINITHPDADKGKALLVAASHLGVPLEAVAAVGDGRNDVPLLQLAGTAIAMGQAPPDVHAAAHIVVPEVAADGVAHALAALASWAG